VNGRLARLCLTSQKIGENGGADWNKSGFFHGVRGEWEKEGDDEMGSEKGDTCHCLSQRSAAVGAEGSAPGQVLESKSC